MGLFDNILNSDESLIIDETPLDFEFVPKLIKYRTNEQFLIANAIKPLFNNRSGRNILVHGSPGVGKSVAIRNVLEELETETDKINIFYINCWHFNTSFKIIMELSEQFGYHFTQNKKTIELFKILQEKLNKQSSVFVFDEIDKVTDLDFLYFLLEKILKKTIILITNYPSWLSDLDKRIKSRLIAETIEFKPYKQKEIRGILEERLKFAFRVDAWKDTAFDEIVKKTNEINDIRAGLFLLKEAGLCAEEKSSREINQDHVKKAILKLDDFTIKKSSYLDEESKKIFEIVKNNSSSKIGDLFKIYQENQGKNSYKTFQRKLTKLAEGKFILMKKQTGKGGNTTIIEVLNY
jgi:archaeal cell division control protein 6